VSEGRSFVPRVVFASGAGYRHGLHRTAALFGPRRPGGGSRALRVQAALLALGSRCRGLTGSQR